MADISDWSATAASNTATPPDGAPEGMAASGVNDTIRECMAAVRRWYVDAEWVDWGHTPTRVDDDTFTVATDLTATYHAGRRLKVTGSATGYCTIASSSYSSPNTTVNVTMDSGNLPATLSAVYVAALSATNDSVPEIADARLSSNVPLKNVANNFTAQQQFQHSGGALTNYLANYSAALVFEATGGFGMSWKIAGSEAMAISSGRNVTINAPSSGNHTVNLASNASLVISGSNLTQTYITNGSATTKTGVTAAGVGFTGTDSNSSFTIRTNDADRIAVGTSGGVQFGAPTGGDLGAGTLNTAGSIYVNNSIVALASDATNASNLSSGTVPDARFPATLPAASGANLTALNASNLGSGTVPDARFPATLPAASGANLTALTGANISGGGTYTPTVTAVNNVSSVTAGVCNYARIGSMVVVSGYISDLDVTSTSAAFDIGISLPIASNFAASTDASGTGTCSDNVLVGLSEFIPGMVYADSSNNRLTLGGFQPFSSGAWRFIAMYNVI